MEMMNTTTVETTVAEPAPVNYLGEYYKKTEADFTGFFQIDTTGDDKIEELTKSVKKIRSELEDAETKLDKEFSKKYATKYTRPEKASYLKYIDRSKNNHYYSIPDGQGVSEAHATNSQIYELVTKSGEISILGGYCFELASIVIKEYKYTISSDNNTVKLKPIREYLYDMIADKIVANDTRELKDYKYYSYSSLFSNFKGDEFISKLYGVSLDLGWTFQLYRSKYINNKSFETIVKTAPKEIMKTLLNLTVTESQANFKTIGISKEMYNEAIKRGLIADTVNLREFINMPSIFNKTEKEWLKLMEQCRSYQDDLAFYSIDYNRGGYPYYYSLEEPMVPSTTLYTLANIYQHKENVIKEFYSFGKYINYVIDGVINQGYSSIKAFTDELNDYLKMCKNNGVKPTLFTNSLKVTHDVASRNIKYVVSAEDELLFQSRYDGFKPFSNEIYSVIAPSCSNDIRDEASQMNSCIASRVKKVIDDRSRIYFLRKNENLKESLVSLEIVNGVLIEAKRAHNDEITDEQKEFLKKFCEDRGYEYQN